MLLSQIATIVEATQNAAAGASASPWIVHALVGALFGFGLILSFIGRRLVRPGFILVGLGCGALVGHLMPPALHPAGEPLAAVAVMGVVGGIAGWLFFRVFVANALGLVVSLVAVLATSAYFQVSPPRLDLDVLSDRARTSDALKGAQDEATDLRVRVEGAIDAAQRRLHEARAAAQGDSPSGALPLAPQEAAEKSSDLLRTLTLRLGEQARDFWDNELTPAARFALLMSAIGGYLLGLVLGFLLPSKASAVVTSLVGPAVWLPAGVYLAAAMNAGFASRLPVEPRAWLIIWGAAAVLGLIVQLTLTGKKKRTQSAKDE